MTSATKTAICDFFATARKRLALKVPAELYDDSRVPPHGDHVLDPMTVEIAATRPIRKAAVLIPIVDREEPMVLLTQRTAHLRDHGGQISFPGGKIDSTDASPLAAALREAEEEIGLKAQAIEPIGYLDLYMTLFGYRIVPLVGRVAPDFSLTLNRNEVDDAFEVPLSFLMSPENHLRHSRDWNGLTRYFYAMPFGDRYIWGATAGMLRSLYERVYA
ncbi:MAG: CoA pyrophosphatase [Hyphomicrobiales bacterium]|nr:CoA pyrophosphatase [Hyphomicrobiales bacterium]